MNPTKGEAYNIGGSRHSNCSMLEAIKACEAVTGKKLDWSYKEDNRIGDHICYYSDMNKFKKDYPNWKITMPIKKIIKEIIDWKNKNN